MTLSDILHNFFNDQRYVDVDGPPVNLCERTWAFVCGVDEFLVTLKDLETSAVFSIFVVYFAMCALNTETFFLKSSPLHGKPSGMTRELVSTVKTGLALLDSQECAGFWSPTSWKKKVKNRRMKRKMREKMESSNTQHPDDTCIKCAPHTLFLSQCQCDIKSVVNQRENVTCEVCCSHLPSVAADCYQL